MVMVNVFPVPGPPVMMQIFFNSAVTAACFDDFADQITMPAVAVLDNAPVHTGLEFYSNIERRREKGLLD